jgi:uncharacterized protein (TIGR02117 family)
MRKLILIFSLLLLSACNSQDEKLYPDDLNKRSVPIYVISHGWHTGIAVGEDYIRDQLPKNSRVPDGSYLMFEWGDGKYFPHNDPGIGLLLRAALLPTSSVIQITGINSRPDFSFPNSTVVQIDITPEGARMMSEFIEDQFCKSPDEQLIFTENGLYPNSTFFEARRLYFFPRTSNMWTAQALQQTGYPISPVLALTAGNVMKQAGRGGKILN